MMEPFIALPSRAPGRRLRAGAVDKSRHAIDQVEQSCRPLLVGALDLPCPIPESYRFAGPEGRYLVLPFISESIGTYTGWNRSKCWTE